MVIGDYLARASEAYASRPALVADGRRVSFEEFEEAANRFANALLDAGIGRGDRVAIMLENSFEASAALFGTLKAGAAFIMVNPSTKPEKLVFTLNDCEAKALVAGPQPTQAPGRADAEVPSLACIVTVGGDPGFTTRTRVIDYERDVSAFSAAPPDVRPIDMDLAGIIYTSGSTGRPKGVCMTHRNIDSATTSIVQYLENVPEDVILGVLPLSFSYGLYQLMSSVKVGATLVLERTFAYPYRIVERAVEERVTGFPAVPTVFAMLLQMNDLEPGSFDSVRYVTNAGAGMPRAHVPKLRHFFRKARIFLMYGVSECVRATYLPPEQVDIRPESVGRGMPNEEVWVVRDDGREAGPNEVGELVVRGGNVMQGYWNRPDETARALRPGRYPWERVLHTGDLFYRDEEGFLYFVSRKDDVIKSRGEKVSPAEVEDAIYEMAGVAEVAVFGVPDPILGEAVKAVVVLVEGAEFTAREVISHCARKLESFMVPKHVEFRRSLPKTATGKIRRASLREEAAEDVPVQTGASDGRDALS